MSLAGYHGQYLHVDLTHNRHRLEPLAEDVLRQFLGGTGLGVYLLLQARQATVDPLSPAAALAFVFSPLVGSPITTSAKFAVVGKSPLTDRYNDALASSGFALAGKGTGVDAIVICGRATAPSILVIDGPHVEILAGARTVGSGRVRGRRSLAAAVGQQLSLRRHRPGRRTPRPLRDDLARRTTRRTRWPGRRARRQEHQGRRRPRPMPLPLGGCHGPGRLRTGPVAAVARAGHRQVSRTGHGSQPVGIQSTPDAAHPQLSAGQLRRRPRIAAETLAQSHAKTRRSCTACTVGCEHLYELAGRDAGVRLEYESLFALGSLCAVDDADAVLAATRRCDDLGLDTISTGGTIAFAMECAELGWLDAPWLRFGRGAAVLQAIEQIAARQDLGDQLAEGSRRLARRLGPAALARTAQVKGLELPGYEPRSLQTLALGLAVAARGADHNRSGAYEADFSDQVDRRHADQRSVVRAVETEDQAALLDSLILCKFLRGAIADIWAESAQMLHMITGWCVTPDELQLTAQRIVTAKKCFNIQAGWTPAEDTLPDRFLTSSPSDDPTARLTRESLQHLVQRYNQRRGWTAAGWIPPAELNRLNLSFLSHDVSATQQTLRAACYQVSLENDPTRFHPDSRSHH